MGDRAKHTPGEWRIKFSTNVVSEQGRLVANCGGHQNSETDENPENEDNAKLISAAPELLDACRLALKWCEDFELPHVPSDLGWKLRAAIAKAEGREEE